MDSINHFDMPCSDVERAKKFYGEVFGWKFNPVPDMSYTMIHAAETDENGMVKTPGAINGGMYERQDPSDDRITMVITVPNLDEHLKKIEEHGGKVVMPKREVGDMGLYAQVSDTEGNKIGIWESLRKQ